MLSGSAMLYYVLDAQLFLKPRLVHYTESILLIVNCFLSLGSYIIQKTFCWWSTVSSLLSHVQPRCFSLSYGRNLCVNQAHIKRIMWGIFKIILGMYEFWALIFQWSWLLNICVNLGHVLHRTIFNNLLSICLSKNVVSKCTYQHRTSNILT